MTLSRTNWSKSLEKYLNDNINDYIVILRNLFTESFYHDNSTITKFQENPMSVLLEQNHISPETDLKESTSFLISS